ncbi:MAG: RNase adapter RapZ [Rhodobacteraceae bacterium]|nr:MAG: RNase adapter RapZ [Paracoccaceae bacterium]
MTAPPDPALDLAIVTGLAGAGRTTAIRALEDAGWEAVDNLPLALLPRLAEAGGDRPLAVGIDSRTRGFSAEAVIETVAALRDGALVAPTLVFLDCADEALIARFAETRRRHPMAGVDDAAQGVARERAVLSALRERADLVIDTTDLSPHALKARVQQELARPGAPGLTVSIQSFAFKRGAPREAEMVMDLRFLRNPHWAPDLRPRDGRDAAVAAYVAEDPLFGAFFARLAEMVLMLLPAYKQEGKAYFGIGLGCTGGRHRSVATAEALAARLRAEGWRVTLRHRELERMRGEREGGGR